MSEQRRLIIPGKPAEISVIDRITNYDVAAGDALSALKEQIEKYRIMSKSATFNDKEAQILKTLVQTLNALSAEDRARRKASEDDDLLRGLTDEQLLEYLKAKKG